MSGAEVLSTTTDTATKLVSLHDVDQHRSRDQDRVLCDGATKITASCYKWIDPAELSPRDWIYGHHLIRKFVSATVAPGGVGKSTLVTIEALALASGRALLGQHVPDEPCCVWLWNLEDPMEELQRRIQAACQHYDITPDQIEGRLFVDSGREQRLVMTEASSDGIRIARPVADGLLTELKAKSIDVLVIDPFVSSHNVSENDNMAIDMVVKEWARIADQANCAVSLVHHTRKQETAHVTAESARGAKALVDGARSVRTLNRMTEDEAEKADVENHRLYFKVFDDKLNLAPPPEKADWYHLGSVELANGDWVGTVTTWTWPDPFESLSSTEDLLEIQRAIDGKMLRENCQARDWVGYEIARVLDMDANAKSDKSKIKSMITTWIANGVFDAAKIKDNNGKPRPIIEVGEWAT